MKNDFGRLMSSFMQEGTPTYRRYGNYTIKEFPFCRALAYKAQLVAVKLPQGKYLSFNGQDIPYRTAQKVRDHVGPSVWQPPVTPSMDFLGLVDAHDSALLMRLNVDRMGIVWKERSAVLPKGMYSSFKEAYRAVGASLVVNFTEYFVRCEGPAFDDETLQRLYKPHPVQFGIFNFDVDYRGNICVDENHPKFKEWDAANDLFQETYEQVNKYLGSVQKFSSQRYGSIFLDGEFLPSPIAPGGWWRKL